MIDLDVEMGRTGTRSVDLALQLAEHATESPGLRFRGVQHYAGHLMHVSPYADRRTALCSFGNRLPRRVVGLRERGFAPEIVTGCGTGTYNIDCDVEVVTDLQVGSYIFMDQGIPSDRRPRRRAIRRFRSFLTVAATAISEPVAGRAVTLDGGFKSFASDTVAPEPLEIAGARFRFGGDEHGILILEKGTQQPLLGSVQRFVTPHCDPTVNLHENYWVHQDGECHCALAYCRAWMFLVTTIGAATGL